MILDSALFRTDLPAVLAFDVFAVDVFLTMNVPESMYDDLYGERFKTYFEPFRFLNGTTRIFPVYDTLQVNDYSKYNMASFSEEHKKQIRETEFPKALEHAFNVGAGKE